MSIVNSWIIFHTNYPDSPISSHKYFRLQLVEELVQPLLDLIASPNCPSHLHAVKGRKVVSVAKRLTGKHFAYKSKKRGRFAVCGQKKGASGKRMDIKTQNHCPKCDTFLCQGSCFEMYHTRSSY